MAVTPRIIPGAEPFYFPGGQIGCVLIHGFTGSPKEMRELGEYLNKKGFTIIESLVVIAILGLLAMLVLVTLQNTRLKECAKEDYEFCDSLDLTPEEAKKKLEGRGVTTSDYKCEEVRKKCRYACAEEDLCVGKDVKTCLEICDIKKEKCINRLNKKKQYD